MTLRANLSAGGKGSLILGAMDTAPHPELWTRIAALLGALRLMLHGAIPELFDGIANEARAQLVAATALVRRYLYVLAAEIILPARAVGVKSENSKETPTRRQSREALFRLTEEAAKSSASSNSETPDTPFLQWALMMEAARRLSLVLNNPQKHALRLARLLRRRAGETLKSLPVPAHILRRLPPWTDALLCRLDEAARPEAWAELNSS